jgi:hypothetical protein
MGYKSPVNLFLDENFKQAVTLPMELQIVILRSASLFLWISIRNSKFRIIIRHVSSHSQTLNMVLMQWVRHLEDGSVNFIEGALSLSALFVVKIDRSIVT